jgi:hypothetical protein
MAHGFAVYAMTDHGVLRSFDSGETWEAVGQSSLRAEAMVGTGYGDLFAVGVLEPDQGPKSNRLFVLVSDRWLERDLVTRGHSDSGPARTPHPALSVLDRYRIVVGSEAGLWVIGTGGTEAYPCGPGVKVQRTTRGDRYDLSDCRPVTAVAVSHSRYGDVPEPLLLVVSGRRMYWCRWGDGADGYAQYWHSPLALPSDAQVTMLTEYGESVAAWTGQGVFLNYDARQANWSQIEPGPDSYPGGELVAVTRSPDGKRIWCSTGAALLSATFDHPWTRDWRQVWPNAAAGKRRHGSAVMPPVFSPSFDRDGLAFALSDTGRLLRSSDGGLSWSEPRGGMGRGVRAKGLIVLASAGASHEVTPDPMAEIATNVFEDELDVEPAGSRAMRLAFAAGRGILGSPRFALSALRALVLSLFQTPVLILLAAYGTLALAMYWAWSSLARPGDLMTGVGAGIEVGFVIGGLAAALVAVPAGILAGFLAPSRAVSGPIKAAARLWSRRVGGLLFLSVGVLIGLLSSKGQTIGDVPWLLAGVGVGMGVGVLAASITTALWWAGGLLLAAPIGYWLFQMEVVPESGLRWFLWQRRQRLIARFAEGDGDENGSSESVDGSELVLVVDDDWRSAVTMAQAFNAHGYQAVPSSPSLAGDPNSGMAKDKVDVVVVSPGPPPEGPTLRPPWLVRAEMLRRLRHTYPEAKLVLLSGDSLLNRVGHPLLVGVAHAQPADVESVVRAVREFLGPAPRRRPVTRRRRGESAESLDVSPTGRGPSLVEALRESIGSFKRLRP